MGATPKYFLVYFDFNEQLDTPLSVQKEFDRFTLIDRQLYAMATVFGDGVITGWDVTEADGLSVQVEPGVGLIEALACQTSFSELVEDLPSNSTVYIYLDRANNTPEDRSVTFFANTTAPSRGILLATVVTGGQNIESIDNTVRTLVGFKQIVADEIAAHRHNGTSAPRIDLTQEVQGLLPTSHMADIDARKITGARLPNSVIPTLDHSLLKNIGQLSHAQLDSIAQSIQKDNIALLGEVDAINLMKLIVDRKYDNVTVDKYFENELAIIPGVSDDSQIDFENSTAAIDTVNNCISGIPELPAGILDGLPNEYDEYGSNNEFEIVSIKWQTDDHFKEAVATTNLTVKDGVKLSPDTVSDRAIETFDEGTSGGDVANYVAKLTETSTVQVVYDSSSAQGPLAARFEHVNARTMEFNKTYPVPQDWSTYDQLIVFVKNSGVSHSAAYLSVYDDDDTLLKTFTLLDRDEVTTIDNPDSKGYAKKTYDISDFIRSGVKRLRFYTDSISNEDEAFYVDTIYLRTNEFLVPQGNLRLRYSTVAPVIFNSVDYTIDLPGGCDFRLRVRVASSLEGLATATFSSLLGPGDVFALPGTDLEIDITFLSDSGRTLTPTLTFVELTMLAPSDVSGLRIGSAAAWNLGTKLTNIAVSTDGVVTMENTSVGDIFFVNENQVSELDTSLVPVVGVGSQYMPISPQQAQNAIDPPTEEEDPYHLQRRDTRGLFNPKSVYRLDNGNFIIADTGNDRVMEIESDGTFVRGFASHNNDFSDQLYALSSNYNPRLGALFITLSKPADIQNFDLTDITLNIGLTHSIRLSNESDKSRTLKGELLPPRLDINQATSGRIDRTMSILLSLDKRAILDATTETVTLEIVTDRNNNSVSSGIECFIGDYSYFGAFGINAPVYANVSLDDRIIVANAAVTSASGTVLTTPSVIEFTTDVGEIVEGAALPLGLTFSYDDILFSDIMLGSLFYIESETTDGVISRRLLMAGLDRVQSTSSSSSSGGAPLPALDDKKMALFTGVVKLVDMDSGLAPFKYVSPDGMFPSDAYIDESGYVVVAESTFTTQAGRIVTLNPAGIGDGKTPPIIRLIEGGMFTKIWDVRPLNDNHIFVST